MTRKIVYVVQAKYRDGAWVDNFFVPKGAMNPKESFRMHVKGQRKKGFKYKLLKREIAETEIIGPTRRRDL
jgi:hypothetical protein